LICEASCHPTGKAPPASCDATAGASSLARAGASQLQASPVTSSAAPGVTDDATAEQPPPCSRTSSESLELGQRAEVKNGLRYRVTGSPLRICVEQTGLPLGRDRAHRLSVSLILNDGHEEARFSPALGQRIAWKGHLIVLGGVRPSHLAPSLWIMVERDSP
jgi:hypothetical protein